MFRTSIVAGFIAAAVLGSVGLAHAQVSVDIGIHLGSPPPLMAVPETPVSYAPSVNGNFFFFDGAYYVYRRGAWYMAPRYNGPWAQVAPEYVPRPLLGDGRCGSSGHLLLGQRDAAELRPGKALQRVSEAPVHHLPDFRINPDRIPEHCGHGRE